MRNPFKCIVNKFRGKGKSKEEPKKFQQVFDEALCEKLKSFGDRKLHCYVRREDGKSTTKELTGQEIIDTFARDFDLCAFLSPKAKVVEEPSAYGICLRAIFQEGRDTNVSTTKDMFLMVLHVW